jgi:hypothetical protein
VNAPVVIYTGGPTVQGGGWNDGQFAEIIVYDRVLTTEERERVWTYLEDKWGI